MTSQTSSDDDTLYAEDVEEAIVFALKRHRATQHLSEHEMWRLAEQVTDGIWMPERPRHLCEVKMMTAAEADCRYCNGSRHFYGDPDLGRCVCQPELDDFMELIG